ncbi:MAG: PorV/PorQ family protein [bacterium]|nr:PorV/PorQ family protein [bacterium]
MRYITVGLVLVLFSTGSVFAASSGGATAQFLKLGVGARAVAMGEAHCAIVEGADATFWNTAGLAATDGYEVAFTHNEWIDDIRYEYVAAGIPVFGYGTVGVSYGQLTMGELEGYDRFGNPTGNFTAGDRLIGVSYGIGLFDMVQLGAGFKYVMSNIENEDATAYAGDFGVIFHPPFIERFSVGGAVYNIGTDMVFIEEGDPLPRGARVGFGYEQPLGDIHDVVLAADVAKYNDWGSYRANFGGEYTLLDMVSGRVGYKAEFHDGEEENPDGFTVGAGFKHGIGDILKLRFDYAFAEMDMFDAAHRVSLGINF